MVERHRRVPMVDFSFFRSRTFLGANIVAFIVSFAMLAMFFFLALYMQNILRLLAAAGGRALPALDADDHPDRPARRTSRRPRRPASADDRSGCCASPARCSGSPTSRSRSGYGTLLPGFVLMGIGMGFVMSPMSLAAMNSVDRAKAGVASGILSMNRMVGGTFGVAVLGAMVATLGRSKIDHLLPAAALPQRAAPGQQPRLGRRACTASPRTSSTPASRPSCTRCTTGCALGAAVALLGALLAWALVAPGVPSAADAGETAPGRRRAPSRPRRHSPLTRDRQADSRLRAPAARPSTARARRPG